MNWSSSRSRVCRPRQVLARAAVLVGATLTTLQHATGQEPNQSQLPREATPSLEIRWRQGQQGNWQPGPAEIKSEDGFSLRVEPISGASIR